MMRITLYGTPTSGHTHRVELLLEMLELPYTYAFTSAEARRSAAFLRLNPLGQIPVLAEGETIVCDSNAILLYLVQRHAPKSGWWPEEALAQAEAQRWFSIAAGELKNGPATARLIQQFHAPGDLATAQAIAHALFAFMDAHLVERRFLLKDTPTLADLACYSYTAHAPEGGVPLTDYPHIRAWLTRVECLPRFKPMPGLPER
ncbi:MAG: glutathione S-transferase [Zoogloeaceae bacterium]|jgi:glutathione S-transferase|nr:glutathione S-transferase [Zoogloeaceae bacterium]